MSFWIIGNEIVIKWVKASDDEKFLLVNLIMHVVSPKLLTSTAHGQRKILISFPLMDVFSIDSLHEYKEDEQFSFLVQNPYHVLKIASAGRPNFERYNKHTRKIRP